MKHNSVFDRGGAGLEKRGEQPQLAISREISIWKDVD